MSAYGWHNRPNVRLLVLCLVVGCQAAPAPRPVSSVVTTKPEPERHRVVVTDTSIELLDKIGFFGGSATLTPESRHQLDALADSIEHNSDIAGIEVQAYANEVPQMFQQTLSDQRARRVVDYLVHRGVSRRRLRAVGVTPAPPGTGNHPEFIVFRR